MKEERKSVKVVLLVFDETARLGEALAIVVRFLQEDLYKPNQRAIRQELLAKALKGKELAQRLISCSAVDYNFGPRVVIGGRRDGASVNGATVRNVKFYYADLFYVVCFSYTIDNLGSHFEFQVLDSFVCFWIGLFSDSYNAKLARRKRTGQSIRTFGEALVNRRHPLEIFDDLESLQKLRSEPAVVIDAGCIF